MTDASNVCRHRSEKGICNHKDAKNRPCWVDAGRSDMCPDTLGFKVDKLAQEEDAGER